MLVCKEHSVSASDTLLLELRFCQHCGKPLEHIDDDVFREELKRRAAAPEESEKVDSQPLPEGRHLYFVVAGTFACLTKEDAEVICRAREEDEEFDFRFLDALSFEENTIEEMVLDKEDFIEEADVELEGRKIRIGIMGE